MMWWAFRIPWVGTVDKSGEGYYYLQGGIEEIRDAYRQRAKFQQSYRMNPNGGPSGAKEITRPGEYMFDLRYSEILSRAGAKFSSYVSVSNEQHVDTTRCSSRRAPSARRGPRHPARAARWRGPPRPRSSSRAAPGVGTLWQPSLGSLAAPGELTVDFVLRLLLIV